MAPYAREIKDIVTPVDVDRENVLFTEDLIPLKEFYPLTPLSKDGWTYEIEGKSNFLKYALYLGEVGELSDGVPEVVILDDSYVLVIHKKPA